MFFLGFIQHHLGKLGNNECFVKLIPGTYRRDKPFNNTGIDKVHIK